MDNIWQVQQQIKRQEIEGKLWSKTYELVNVEECVEFESVLYYLVEWDGGTKSWIDGLNINFFFDGKRLNIKQQLEFWKDVWKEDNSN